MSSFHSYYWYFFKKICLKKSFDKSFLHELQILVVGQKISGRHVSCASCPLEKENAKNNILFILFF